MRQHSTTSSVLPSRECIRGTRKFFLPKNPDSAVLLLGYGPTGPRSAP